MSTRRRWSPVAAPAGMRTTQGGLAPNDFAPAAGIATWIGRVAGVEDAPLPADWRDYDCRNNRLALLALRQDGLDAAIAAAAERHGAARIGVFVGSSTSGVLSTEIAASRPS